MDPEYDVLDLVDWTPLGRWYMHYRDGSTKHSVYRDDLIRNESETALTERALAAWCDWIGPVVPNPGGG